MSRLRSLLGRSCRFAAVGLPAAAGALALHTGWASPVRAWQEATGWERLADPPTPQRTFRLAKDAEPLVISWLGHSGFLLEWAGARLLLDPNTSSRCTVSPRLLEAAGEPARLGRVDAALVSHAHYDHLDLPTLAAAAPAELLLPAGSEGYARSLGARGVRVAGLRPGESRSVGRLLVTAVPAAHHGNRFHPLASPELAVGWVVRRGEAAVYFAGDTGWGDHLAAIGRQHGPQLAILPIGSWRPRWPLAVYHLSPEEAAEAALVLGAGRVVPCHFGTFVLALDRPDAALPRFAEAAAARGVAWSMPALLRREEPR